ncbi:TAXI family TRAP transporter solute-binding subunit [uncultured Thiodictyon sp.]|uniref:TAXI family TRAP transporter solute-binding subunit n=1 Tax=uncultured Thiodictyon sp. TaxID=1846217 RepID=UPI0025E0DE2B|nr:TAXI family TRAP transporter solute-binding subunit [uncultured Thiodictyon sp.]
MTSEFSQRVFYQVGLAMIAVAMTLYQIAAIAEDEPMSSATKRDYVLATGFTGGTYYHAGVAIATQIDVRMIPEASFGLIAIPTAGSQENLELLTQRHADLAIVQALVLEQLRRSPSQGTSSDVASLASIGWLWQNVEHFLLLEKYVSSGSLADLRSIVNKPVYLGAESSGTRISTTSILSSLGIHFPVENLRSTSYDAVVGELKSGPIVFASLPGGDPVSSVTRAFSSLGNAVRLLAVTDDELALIRSGAAVWQRAIIPAATYPLQLTDVASISQPNVLVVRQDLPEEDVYRITREIYTHVARLAEVHPALMQLDQAHKNIDSIWPPLHPGARRYFEERSSNPNSGSQPRPTRPAR